MAFQHGKGAHFELDNTAGTMTDISGNIDTTDLNRLIETAETTTYEKNSKTYIVGLADATCSVGGKWERSLNTAALGGAEPVSRTFNFGPEGDTSGDVLFSGECIMRDFSVSASVGDAVMWSATLQITGDLTTGSYA